MPTNPPANNPEPPAAQETRPGEVRLNWGVRIPLRDGIALNATLYRPLENEPVPAIFILTPYVGDAYHERAVFFSRNSYAFLLVDCRGRGNSDGTFRPFESETRDAADVIEWLARQDWCDGQVAMWGGSYSGCNQWLALKENPSALKTIVPAAAAHAGVDFPFFKNIFYNYAMRWLTLVSGRTDNASLFADEAFWNTRFYRLYREHAPFNSLDRVVGNQTTIFQDWLAHPAPDSYWDAMALTPAEYARFQQPVLTITGQFDDDQAGALHYYQEHMRCGDPAATARHFLVIGPWGHAGTRTPKAEFGGLEFGPESLLDLNRLHQEWYDWTLKAGPRPAFLQQLVAYYVTGAEVWQYAPSLEALTTGVLKLYLDSTGAAGSVFHSGSLDLEPPNDSPPDSYIYDPLDTRPAELEREPNPHYLTDQRQVLRLCGDGLVYHSSPFPEATVISGFCKLRVWIALDVPDTDFSASIYEILPDGGSILLGNDLLRARYRQSPRRETPVPPGEILPYKFEAFPFCARRIAAGSRIRLLFTSPNSIQLEKNYNAGGVVAAESGQDARPAQVTLYHDRAHPSCLELPLGPVNGSVNGSVSEGGLGG